MPHELPIACTLNATGFAAREALMAELGRDALIDVDHAGTRAQLRFAAGAGVRRRVDAFVDGESRCCAFLTMRVTRSGDQVLLDIDAPAHAEQVLAEMVAAFGPADREAV
jgi:hypothetical protein